MISAAKALLKRHWPALRLRSIVLAVLLFAAAMPAIEAIWLRGYEDTLVRQTEAELVVQADALASTAAVLWPGARPEPSRPGKASSAPPESSDLKLGVTPILPERPAPSVTTVPLDPDALAIASRLKTALDNTTWDTLASIVLLDSHGSVVRGQGLGGSLAGLPEVGTALAGVARSVLRRKGDYRPRHRLEWLSRASDLRVHHARPVIVNGRVVGVLLLSRSPRALFRDAYENLWKVGAGGGVIVLLLIGLSGLVSRGVTRPVEALSIATHEVAAGRGIIPETPATAATEIRALYEDFRVMAEAIHRRSSYLRDFAAAVSHEFKTPLAGIGGAVELLQDHFETMNPGERARFLDNIAADNRRLSQLVARLLDLARADMARPEADAVTDVGPAMRRVADALSTADFTVAIDQPPTTYDVALPAPVIEAVLSTLLDNSRQARAPRATVSARDEPGYLVLAISDDGPGIPASDRERLFEPFFTTRRAEGGTGLGLPIARSLIEGHGGRLILCESPVGARFDLWLPIRPGGRPA